MCIMYMDTGIHGNMDTEITLQVYMDKDLKRINVLLII